MSRAFIALALAVILASCSPKPEPANPAFWEVTAPDGGKAWLLGTIHSLERPAQWRRRVIDDALGESKLVMVELDGLNDAGKGRAIFARLATSPGHGPLGNRVDPEFRKPLLDMLERHGLSDSQFGTTETWAAALTLAQAETKAADSRYGIDRAVIEAAKGKPVVELEGFAGQLSIFDRLPEEEQRDLLQAVVKEATAMTERTDLASAWRTGNMNAIENETRRGMLADPELRQALFVGRNTAWSGRIAEAINSGRKPFVAVGAAHMAGPDGLPAMLTARGFEVRRIQ